MRPLSTLSWTLAVLSASGTVAASRNYSDPNLLPPAISLFDDRPPECPPCFNCQLDAFQCTQFAPCNKYTGKCSCPPGFGGDDCSQPTCGSLADGANRAPRQDRYCDCKDGWGGINCNVCQTDNACNAKMPDGEGGVCYKQGLVVNENYQMCDVTNRKILDQLKDQKPQVTFSCETEEHTCNFQCMCEVWISRCLLYEANMFHSLGRPEGIFLLWSGYL